jgi:hypothetical protein
LISTFVIDASDTVISVEGSANLGKESLDMAARAEPRDTSPFTVRTPVNITGTFSDPKVRSQAGPLAGRAAASIALGAINPLLALIPFADPGGEPEAGCQPQKPAKAPEKTKAPSCNSMNSRNLSAGIIATCPAPSKASTTHQPASRK